MRIALVTGAGNGLGAAISMRLVKDGFTVFLGDIDGGAAKTVAETLGEAALPLELDVRCEGAWDAAMKAVKALDGHLDVLINNAGIIPTGTVESLSVDSFRAGLEVNLVGPFLGSKYAIPLMRAQGGSIVNISSRAALRPNPDLAGYGASKAGLTMLTKSVALHCAKQGYNIRCNSVHPGLIATKKNDEIAQNLGVMEEVYAQWRGSIPLGRIGQPDEVAALVSYLVSSQASFATGAEFVLDGGSSL